ncbi:MAG: signal peptidase I [Oligoflexia bacterium]|nr:signal peptidase I [Oligoflexia bacterium]
MRWLRRLALSMTVLLAVLMLPARRVTDDEMSPNLQRGDLVWVLPVQPLRGDVVVLQDPLDPGRTVLRRLLTGADTKVAWDDGGIRANGKRIRQTDMGMLQGDRLMKEVIWSKPPARAFNWLVRLRKPPAPWTADAVQVPEGSWYLLADDRDRAVDSRWWGPVSQTAFKGVIRLRIGKPDPWRGWISWLKGWE